IDLIPPAAPTIADITDAGKLVFNGRAEPGSTVRITLVGTGVIGAAKANAMGDWTLNDIGFPLAPGAHSFTATATDRAGNMGPESAVSTVDTTLGAPVISAITDDTGSSSADGVTADNTLVLSGTAAAGRTITVKMSGTVLGTTTSDGS